ncbi:MAG: 50S ribosomal protein L10 [Patescibacteria group bacterium]
MLTKAEKKEQIELGADLTKKSKALVFADFTGISIEEIKKLKSELRKAGAQFKVIKKRLLKLALKNAGVDFDPTQFEAQVGTVFATGELSSVAAQVYKFSKDLEKAKKNFVILGAYDGVEKAALDKNQFLVIAKLPSREILLAQLVGVMSGPIRAFMYIADQLSKKSVAAEPASSAGEPASSAREPVSSADKVAADNVKTVENNQQTQ